MRVPVVADNSNTSSADQQCCMQDANYELYLATSPDVAKTRGKYFVSNRARGLPAAASDAGNRKRLWEILEQQTGQQF